MASYLIVDQFDDHSDISYLDTSSLDSSPSTSDLDTLDSVINAKLFRPLANKVLRDIMKETMKLNREDTKARVRVLQHFVQSQFIPALKATNPLFNVLFRKVHHTGSYYDGCRCGVADEFDLNLCLSNEFLQDVIKFVEVKNAPGFLKLVLTSEVLLTKKPAWNDQWPEFLKHLTSPSDDVTDGFCRIIDPSLMRSWFQDVIKKSNVDKLTDNDNISSVKFIAHGPALTMKIKTRHLSSIIDVDVVPVFDFKCGVLASSNISYDIGSNSRPSDTFFLVPKMKRNVLDGDQVSILSKNFTSRFTVCKFLALNFYFINIYSQHNIKLFY